MIDVGSRIRDYEVVARLKSGGMATLFLARRVGAAGFARHVAIKVVHPHLGGDPEFVAMFVDEALLSARIQHPNVVHVEELGQVDGTYFLAMEYVHGAALSTLLAGLSTLQRRMAPDLAVWIACQVADGLHAAHELRDEHGVPLQVVHRDVSPQNVLIAHGGHVKLIDFGIAKAVTHAKRTATGALKGKLRYMAPEQAYGREIDRRADVYALGIVLWEMLTMHRYFQGSNDLQLIDEVRDPKARPPSQYAHEISPALDAVLLSALAKDPAARPQTGAELRRALLEAMPMAAAVDPARVGEVLGAVLGERLEAKRRELPDSLRGVMVAGADPTRAAPLRAQDVIRGMTVSAPGVTYEPDGVSSAAPPAVSEAMLSAPIGPSDDRLVSTPMSASGSLVPPPSSGRRDRLFALGMAAVALLALGVAGGVLLGRGEAPPSGVTATALPAAPSPAAEVAPTPVAVEPSVALAPDAGAPVADPVPASPPSEEASTAAAAARRAARDRRRRRGGRDEREDDSTPDPIRSVTKSGAIFDDGY